MKRHQLVNHYVCNGLKMLAFLHRKKKFAQVEPRERGNSHTSLNIGMQGVQELFFVNKKPLEVANMLC